VRWARASVEGHGKPVMIAREMAASLSAVAFGKAVGRVGSAAVCAADALDLIPRVRAAEQSRIIATPRHANPPSGNKGRSNKQTLTRR
jgi:hypothetical protein